jgi:hypothetical protein
MATFNVLLNVENRSTTLWRGDTPETALKVVCAGTLEKKKGGRTDVSADLPPAALCDYLAPTLSTLVGVQFQAPAEEGELVIQPGLSQGQTPFQVDAKPLRIRVSGGGPGLALRLASALRTRVRRLVRP